jgi:hypothetical protein
VNSNTKNWMDFSNLLIAVVALAISLFSFVVASGALRLARKQDERRKLVLVPSLINGYFQFFREEHVHAYAFLLSISNPSDSDNALANVELEVEYTRSGQTKVTARLPSSLSRGGAFAKLPDFSLLPLPARIDAHQTLMGWALFLVPQAILQDATIEGYKIALFDSNGGQTFVVPIMVREHGDEVIPPLQKDSSS